MFPKNVLHHGFIAGLIMLMLFCVIHHHTLIRSSMSQVLELLVTVRVVAQINQLQLGWWLQHAVIVTRMSHISRNHPSQWRDAHARGRSPAPVCQEAGDLHWAALPVSQEGTLQSDNNPHPCLITILLFLPSVSSLISYSVVFPPSLSPPQIITQLRS